MSSDSEGTEEVKTASVYEQDTDTEESLKIDEPEESIPDPIVDSDSEAETATKPSKPKLRSIPASMRVVMRQWSDDKSKSEIIEALLNRYEVDKANDQKRMDRLKKCLDRAIERGINDKKDISETNKKFRFNPSSNTKRSSPKSKPKSSTKKSKTLTITPPAPVVVLNPQPQPKPNTYYSPIVPEGSVFDYKWQYADNGWCDYDKEASKEVELAFQEYTNQPGLWDVRSVKSGHFEYQVDFINMKQTNILHQNHTTRDIRRVNIQ